jgi:hypothetical protein
LRQLNFGFRASFTLFAVVAIILFFAELSAFSHQPSASSRTYLLPTRLIFAFASTARSPAHQLIAES